MNKIKYIKISKNIKIRYLTNNLKKNPYIIFLHGFMSDIDGEKPKVFSKFCSKLKLGFFAVEYSGHGKSAGKFTQGNITKWSNQVNFFIKKKVKNKVAMTGELTITGEVLAIGGLKEKILAAIRSGAEEVIIPKSNKKDLKDFEKDVQGKINIHLVSDITDVFKHAFVQD